MKLLLTSNVFENKEIGTIFKKLFEKNINQVKILFIPTAARTDEELHYVEESKTKLLDLGILKSNIFSYYPEKLENSNFDEFDCIYVCGGNTYYLLNVIKKSRFDKKIIELVNNGVVYVGVSAGSIIAGPNISITGDFDENDCGITDLTSLNLTETIVSPHFCDNEKEYVSEFRKKSNCPVIGLKDNEAVLIIK
jgi:dipeptidase E